jgi:hypothetical protein
MNYEMLIAHKGGRIDCAVLLRKEPRHGKQIMNRILAAIQMIIIILIVVFATWQLFLGHFEMALASFPLLVVFYLFVTIRQRRP